MPRRRLVVDANILIRAVLGRRVRLLIADACDRVSFYVAEANYDEATHYLAELTPARGISEVVWRDALDTLMVAVQLIGQETLSPVENAAKARIARRDERDWPAVAASLLLDCPIWTEDRDFFGAGVATWTTETISIYLDTC
ncbi:PIN domain-containing protein [Acidithiobacillus ferriphilus]|uniref:PIN domain-containing protein n=1 Tax=Acidithiobacillus ferriphilus TaxID=1689834 RepID=UPI003F511F76